MQKKQQHVILGELVEDVERLARHISIIEALRESQPAGIIRLSQLTDLPEHKVRYSLRILEKNGVIKPSREGAVLTASFMRSHEKIAENVQKISKDISSILKRLTNALREN
jgi:predicted transcriptional regulator